MIIAYVREKWKQTKEAQKRYTYVFVNAFIVYVSIYLFKTFKSSSLYNICKLDEWYNCFSLFLGMCVYLIKNIL